MLSQDCVARETPATMVLPTSSANLGASAASRAASVQRWKYFRRIFKFQQMDFEMAMSQMFYLCVSPQRV